MGQDRVCTEPLFRTGQQKEQRLYRLCRYVAALLQVQNPASAPAVLSNFPLHEGWQVSGGGESNQKREEIIELFRRSFVRMMDELSYDVELTYKKKAAE